MNVDRCQHVPTSPGQSVCSCRDRQMWLEFVVQVQSETIARLLRERSDSSPLKITEVAP